MISISILVAFFVCVVDFVTVSGFAPTGSLQSKSHSTTLFAKLSPLPAGISPFEKSTAKSLDIQGGFRNLAAPAIQTALRDGITQLEIDFPPLTGGDQSKTQFDDFDNVQELDANRDWCVQIAPTLASKQRDIWFILPDDKECELAKVEWTGQRYREAAKFTSIRAAVMATSGESGYTKAWGSSIASTLNKATGGDGILADSSTLDELTAGVNRLNLVCQPGEGGPTEDWINVEQISKSDPSQPTVVVNGALDKVRDGYYPGIFFPVLAKTVPFYKQFESVFILKPISDKGVYGWLYRVYPEPWQVVLQYPERKEKGGVTTVTVRDVVALTTDKRPPFRECVDALQATTAAQT